MISTGKFKERMAAKKEEPARVVAPVQVSEPGANGTITIGSPAPVVEKQKVELLAIQRPKRKEAVCCKCGKGSPPNYGVCGSCGGAVEPRDVMWTVAEGNVAGVRRRVEKRGDHSQAVMVAELARTR